MKKETEKIIIEAIIIGALLGIIMVIAVNTFIKHECLCYDGQGGIYPTTLFQIKKISCSEQCAYFGEKEGIDLTDIEPENVKRKSNYPFIDYNYSLEVE